MSALTTRGLADRIVDLAARRPRGRPARRAYGGALGAPRGHERVFERLLELARPLAGQHVLELGCGGGRLIERVLQAGPAAVAGIDHSAEMIRLTQARNRQAAAPTLRPARDRGLRP